MPESVSHLVQFLKDDKCLIVEPSPAFASGMQASLQRMGVPLGQIQIARKFADAKTLLAELRPKLLITEYDVDRQLGLALIELHDKIWEEGKRVSIMVTRNTSDSVVAEAAEEQVDAVILKPFSPEMFDQKLLAVLARKLNPSPYLKKIQDGKIQRVAKEFDQALQMFVEAKPLNDKPTLACFYAGDTYRLKGDHARALAEFREGRAHQPLHYKCIVGEFEGLMAEKRYQEAFQLVGPLKTNYPLSPKRLAQIFMATIFTLRFEDIGDYYELYQRLDQRSPELIKVASMALFTAGRFYLQRKDMARAQDLFDKSILISARNLAHLERVIDELIKGGAIREAQEFLQKAQASDVGTPALNRLAFKVDRFVLTTDQLLERGRKLVMSGEGSPEIYEIVVRLMASNGKKTLAEAVISRALQSHPDLRAKLYRILESPDAA